MSRVRLYKLKKFIKKYFLWIVPIFILLLELILFYTFQDLEIQILISVIIIIITIIFYGSTIIYFLKHQKSQ